MTILNMFKFKTNRSVTKEGRDKDVNIFTSQWWALTFQSCGSCFDISMLVTHDNLHRGNKDLLYKISLFNLGYNFMTLLCVSQEWCLFLFLKKIYCQEMVTGGCFSYVPHALMFVFLGGTKNSNDTLFPFG